MLAPPGLLPVAQPAHAPAGEDWTGGYSGRGSAALTYRV